MLHSQLKIINTFINNSFLHFCITNLTIRKHRFISHKLVHKHTQNSKYFLYIYLAKLTTYLHFSLSTHKYAFINLCTYLRKVIKHFYNKHIHFTLILIHHLLNLLQLHVTSTTHRNHLTADVNYIIINCSINVTMHLAAKCRSSNGFSLVPMSVSDASQSVTKAVYKQPYCYCAQQT